MANTKGDKGSSTGGLTTLKIGSRVRCTDDGVQGRITWANGIAVKIQWDDGEQVTWRRDTLADRPIDILPSDSEDEQTAANPETPDEREGVAAELSRQETVTAPAVAEESTSESHLPLVERVDPVIAAVVAEPPLSAPETAHEQPDPATSEAAAETLDSPKQRRKTSMAPKDKKLSALDAAAKVLGETSQPMTCQELIAAMAQKGYWTSPGGQTPAATLYSAMLKEITSKGSSSRFVKVERGKFGRSGVA